MHKAYDTILQSEVSAVLAAKNCGFEPYRYECACCGEEVYIAAAFSTSVEAHFRHRNGNNDVECENYLGQYGAISTDSRSRRSKRERVEFYYSNISKTFSIGLRFSAEEIKSYEQENVDFEIRTKDSAIPFYSVSINSSHFSPDVTTLVPLNDFSFSYCLSNTLGGIKRKYDFIKPGNSTPTFFKLQGNDSDFKAKLVRSTVLFTNIQYFVIFQNHYSTPRDIELPDEILVNETVRFESMGYKFLGKTLSIRKKTARSDEILNSWGYQLESSESLTLLWPPAPIVNEVSIITSDEAFVFTSFELQAHGNINVEPTDIFEVNHGISRILVKPKTKIFKKNTEIVIDKVEKPIGNYSFLTQSKSIAIKFAIPNDGDSYFLFNRFGVTPLNVGQVVLLTPKSEIRRYNLGYLIGCFYPDLNKQLVGEALLEDILKHCKRTEALDLNVFASLEMSNVALRYIDKCTDSNSINVVAKQRIMEGLI
ncbi:hypothetical protein ACPUYX_09825 [Desulfosporosinus sp. SYSU MS00001]|uniref:hypothetical protein n=1 Tax=Desulfosporosinus sp. SYSU MS00001 TaxID=3416284 RepID=UPI003CF5236E